MIARDLHRDVLRVGLEALLVRDVGLKGNHDADAAAAVHVGDERALGIGEAADLHVLADREDLVAELLLDGHAHADRGELQKRVDIGGLVGRDCLGAGFDEVHELIVLRDEVGLRIDLDHNADLGVVVDHREDDALGRDAAGLLGGRGEPLLTENLNRFFHISIRFGQSLFAVHHAAIGLLTQRLYVFCSECHS